MFRVVSAARGRSDLGGAKEGSGVMGAISPIYILSGCLLLVAVTIFGSAPHSHAIGDWLFKWQTLIGAGLAFVGAYWTVGQIREQIRQTDNQHKAELRRRHNAARVALPLVLAEVSGYVQKIAANLTTEIEAYSPTSAAEPREALVRRGYAVAPLPDVDLPAGVIDAFQAFVETLDADKEVRHVAELLSSIQILKARYDSIDFSEAGMELALYGRLLDAAKVAYLNDCLYNFGRYLESRSFAVVGEIDHAEAWEKIRERAHSLIFLRAVPDVFFDGINTPIDRWKERNESPWLEKFDVD